MNRYYLLDHLRGRIPIRYKLEYKKAIEDPENENILCHIWLPIQKNHKKRLVNRYTEYRQVRRMLVWLECNGSDTDAHGNWTKNYSVCAQACDIWGYSPNDIPDMERYVSQDEDKYAVFNEIVKECKEG